MKRRDVLLSGGATVAGMAFAGSVPARAGAAEIGFDVADPVANMHAAVRMMGSADGTATYGYNRGRLFGMRPEEHALPLVDMETGKPIDAMVNPYTRENIELTPLRGGGGFNNTFSIHGQGRDGRSDFEANYGPYVYDWMGFMNMGQWPGHHIWRSQGRKALAAGDLPAGFSRRTEEVFPGLLAEVEAWSA